MDIVMRCHVKDQARLSIMERSLISLFSKKINNLGRVFVFDDCSPLHEEVKKLCSSFEWIHYRYDFTPGELKKSLIKSFMIANSEEPVLCCVDDLVFGKGSFEILLYLINEVIPSLNKEKIKWATIGTFACYSMDLRINNKKENLDIWDFHPAIFYSLLCHIYNPVFMKFMMDQWVKIKNNEKEYPFVEDDIWVAKECIENDWKIFNTMEDYTQHTGMNQRSFNSNFSGSSNYTSSLFVGE